MWTEGSEQNELKTGNREKRVMNTQKTTNVDCSTTRLILTDESVRVILQKELSEIP